MGYKYDSEDQIYVDYITRLGHVIDQYDKLNTNEKKFKVSLYLSVLQSILTYLNEANKRNPGMISHVFGLDSDITLMNDCWKENTYHDRSGTHENKSKENFITHLRNSLSHPSKTTEDDCEETGFRQEEMSDYIHKIRFIDTKTNINTKRKQKSVIELTVDQLFALVKNLIEGVSILNPSDNDTNSPMHNHR